MTNYMQKDYADYLLDNTMNSPVSDDNDHDNESDTEDCLGEEDNSVDEFEETQDI